MGLLVRVPLIVAQNDTNHYWLTVNKLLRSDSMEYWLVMVIQYLTDTMELCLLCPTNLTLTFPDKSSLRPRSYFMSGPESSPQALISCHLVLLFPACPPAPLQADAPQREVVRERRLQVFHLQRAVLDAERPPEARQRKSSG